MKLKAVRYGRVTSKAWALVDSELGLAPDPDAVARAREVIAIATAADDAKRKLGK